MGLNKRSVGVIIPFYGSKQKLFRTLESVEKQTVAPNLVVLIDDCGPDPLTKEDELYWKGRIPQLEYIYNQHNLGAGLTRNVGMDFLEGKVAYLHFLDSDDAISDNFYESLVDVLNQNGLCVAAFSKTIYQNPRGDINPDMKETSLYDGLFRYRPWATSSLLWRESIVRDTQWLGLNSCEDTFFEIMVALKSDVIIGVSNSILLFYQENCEAVILERNKANVKELYRNRVKLYRFSLTVIPISIWTSGHPKKITLFTRRNIDFGYDKLFLESLLLSFCSFTKTKLLLSALIRYAYLKVALVYYGISKK